MSTVPVFLVKRDLENVFLIGFDDAKHWALKVRNKYYHLGVENGERLYLDKTDFSEDLVSWSMLGERRKEHYVGNTSMSHSEIKQAGKEILSAWESKNCTFGLLDWNCKRFVGFLLINISPTLPSDWGMKMKTIEIPLALLVPRVIRFLEMHAELPMSPKAIDKLTTWFRNIWMLLLKAEEDKSSGRPVSGHLAPFLIANAWTPLEYFSPENFTIIMTYFDSLKK